MPKNKINPKRVADDILAGIRPQEAMRKYLLSATALTKVCEQLVRASFLTQSQVVDWFRGSEALSTDGRGSTDVARDAPAESPKPDTDTKGWRGVNDSAESDLSHYEPLKILRKRIPEIVGLLSLESSVDLHKWQHTLDGKILPRLDPDFPLLVAIAGTANSGKSTLFNSLVDGKAAKAKIGPKPGLTRRALVGIPSALLKRQDFLKELFHPLGVMPEPLQEVTELQIPGRPKFVSSDRLPENIVLMDTPDFDTGDKEGYFNRENSQRILAASDVLIYIFTLTGFGKTNTDFLSDILTGVGQRKSVLVHRLSSVHPDEVARTNTDNIAQLLYDKFHEQYVLGRWRADESNDVVSGDSPMPLRSLDGKGDILSFLSALKPRELKREQWLSAMADVIQHGRTLVKECELSLSMLELYRHAVEQAQTSTVLKCVDRFPLEDYRKLLQEEFYSTAPWYERGIRRTTRVLNWAPEKAYGLVRRLAGGKSTPINGAHDDTSTNAAQANLETAVTEFYEDILNQDITAVVQTRKDGRDEPLADYVREKVDRCHELWDQLGYSASKPSRKVVQNSANTYITTFSAPAHPALQLARERLQEMNWQKSLEAITSEAMSKLTRLISDSEDGLFELIKLQAQEARCNMSNWESIKETLSAAGTLAPAALGIIYVCATGDPFGGKAIAGFGGAAAPIGILGANDLLALAALPAVHQLDQESRKRALKLLQPVFEKWHHSRVNELQSVIMTYVSGQLITTAREVETKADSLIAEIRSALQRLATATEPNRR